MEFVMECGPCDGDKKYAIDVVDTLASYQRHRFKVAMKVQFYGATPLAARGAPRYDRTDDRPLTQDQLFEAQLDYDDWADVHQHAVDSGVPFFASVFSLEDAQKAVDMGIRRVKIASGDITNHQLIRQVAPLFLSAVISTGASTEAEVRRAIDWFAEGMGGGLTLLACHLAYPTSVYQAHLRRVSRLQRAFPTIKVGYSDHTSGTYTIAPLMALRAEMWEKHFSIRDKDCLEGDHSFAIRPNALRHALLLAEITDDALGMDKLFASPQELAAREGARRSLASGPQGIKKDTAITRDNTCFLRPATGISMEAASELLGTMVATQDIPPYTTITPGMVG